MSKKRKFLSFKEYRDSEGQLGHVATTMTSLTSSTGFGSNATTHSFPASASFVSSSTSVFRDERTIWANETLVGTRHNVTVERIYKDGDDWKSTLDNSKNIMRSSHT